MRYSQGYYYSPWGNKFANLTDDQISDKLNQLYADRNEMLTERNDLLNRITAEQVDAWKAKGGCLTCHGSKLVVTWSTLDGPGWTERGQCSACTEESKVAGLEPGARYAGGYSAYESGPMSPAEIGELGDRRAEFALLNTYEIHLAELDRDVEDEERHCIVEKGKRVEVIRGRKVPKGTLGECFWTGPDKLQRWRANRNARPGRQYPLDFNVEREGSCMKFFIVLGEIAIVVTVAVGLDFVAGLLIGAAMALGGQK